MTVFPTSPHLLLVGKQLLGGLLFFFSQIVLPCSYLACRLVLEASFFFVFWLFSRCFFFFFSDFAIRFAVCDVLKRICLSCLFFFLLLLLFVDSRVGHVLGCLD